MFMRFHVKTIGRLLGLGPLAGEGVTLNEAQLGHAQKFWRQLARAVRLFLAMSWSSPGIA